MEPPASQLSGTSHLPTQKRREESDVDRDEPMIPPLPDPCLEPRFLRRDSILSESRRREQEKGEKKARGEAKKEETHKRKAEAAELQDIVIRARKEEKACKRKAEARKREAEAHEAKAKELKAAESCYKQLVKLQIRLLVEKSWSRNDFDQGREVLSERAAGNMRRALLWLRARCPDLSPGLAVKWDSFVASFPAYFHKRLRITIGDCSRLWQRNQFIRQLQQVLCQLGVYALRDPSMPEVKRAKVGGNQGDKQAFEHWVAHYVLLMTDEEQLL